VLILTRKVGESIVLDGGIRITVVQSDAGGVRLGIDAPAEIGIFREEVLERMASENRRASVDPDTLLEFVRRMAPLSEGQVADPEDTPEAEPTGSPQGDAEGGPEGGPPRPPPSPTSE
jgi:carbon storage regulator